jgi:hypothetical protein
MSRPFSLDAINVASPCKASWEAMRGDNRVRFCSECRQNVYNLSEMSRAEAKSLLLSREGRTCVRFYRRNDGTLLTGDCPVGLRAWRRRLIVGISAAAVLLVSLIVTGFALALSGSSRPQHHQGQGVGPLQAFWDIFFPRQPEMIMGDLCPPPANIPEEIPAPPPENPPD